MKVVCDRNKLAHAFSLAASVAPTRSSKEVLNYVKIIAEGGTLSLIATDLESGLRVPCPEVTVDIPGTALLNTARMSAILREWVEEKITIEVEGNSVVITGAHSRFVLPTADPLEYPGIREPDDSTFSVFPARGLAEAIKRTVFACDSDSTRFALGGVFVSMTGADSVLVGTDGRRLACAAVPGELHGKEASFTTVVPMKSASIIGRMIADCESVKVISNGNECWFETERGVFWSRLVEGRYPKWQQVIPSFEDWVVDINLSAGPLGSLIRQAAVVADSESRGVDFTFAEGTLTANAAGTDIGQSKVDMPIAYDGEKLTVKLDYRFVSDFLRVLDPTAVVRLRIKNANLPTLMSTEDNFTYTVMPMARD